MTTREQRIEWRKLATVTKESGPWMKFSDYRAKK
mgnify:CR=1 FL=1